MIINLRKYDLCNVIYCLWYNRNGKDGGDDDPMFKDLLILFFFVFFTHNKYKTNSKCVSRYSQSAQLIANRCATKQNRRAASSRHRLAGAECQRSVLDWRKWKIKGIYGTKMELKTKTKFCRIGNRPKCLHDGNNMFYTGHIGTFEVPRHIILLLAIFVYVL